MKRTLRPGAPQTCPAVSTRPSDEITTPLPLPPPTSTATTAGDTRAARTLEATLDVFTHHYVQARNQLPVAWDGEAHQRLRALSAP